ncbi:MAG TPA: EamA family transporter [Mycobacteriales bacterium]|nr:EamA family transporter [Mycobacteriales bacterium]
MTALLALLSSGLWGLSDFLGGTVSRRMPPLVVVGVSQLVALVLLLPIAAGTGGFHARGYALDAALAGLAGLVGLAAFYRALATGTMGVVAPIAALSVAVPVLVGVLGGHAPGEVQAAGLATAVAGVVLASGPSAARPGGLRPLGLALLAALGFGVTIVFIARGSRGSVVMTLLVMRATGVSLLTLAALALRHSPRVGRSDVPVLAATGIADVCANACYAVASTRGLLAVVAVLASLYPAVTVLLARRFHHEALRPVQGAGVAAALVGIALIAAGGGTR